MNPPRGARWLIRLLTAREDRSFLLADLEDRFESVARSEGVRAARRWYWRQALTGVPWALRGDLPLLRARSWTGFAGDVRFGARALVRRPFYTGGVAATLMLGLATATVVGSIAWGVWLAPMPFPDPDRVVRVYELEAPEQLSSAAGDAEAGRWRLSPPLLEDLRANSWQTLAGVAGLSRDDLEWSRGEDARRLSALSVSPEFFTILAIAPRLGRLPSESAAREVVVDHDFWERSLGADPDAADGLQLTLDGQLHTVVGVVSLPAGYPGDADVARLFSFTDDDLTEGMRGARYLDAVARVRPSHTVADASGEVAAFIGALGDAHPQHAGWSGQVVGLATDISRPFRGVFTLLLAAVTTFLLVAAVNVAGLVVARKVEELRDRSIRLALGASEGRLLRQSVVESVLVALGGSVGSIALAAWLLPLAVRIAPQDLPRLADVALSPASVALVFGVGAFVGVSVGVVAYSLSRSADPSLRRATRGRSVGSAHRPAFVVGQVALTTVLTAGVVTILQHVSSLRAIDLGFESSGVSTTTVALSGDRYATDEARSAVWRGMLEGLEARGVRAAAGFNMPMSGSNMTFGFVAQGEEDQAFAQYHGVSDGYFSVLGIDVLDGRAFDAGDRAETEPVAIVSEAVASRHYGEGGAVGRTMRLVGTERTIVGVVASTTHHGPGAEVQAEVYVPLAQDPWAFATVVAEDDPEALDRAVAGALSAIDPNLLVPPAAPYDDHLRAWFAPLTLQLSAIGVLAVLGLLLASLGLYSVLAYQVTARLPEMGLRRALGAPAGGLLASVVGRGMAWTGVGALLGLAAWYGVLPAARGVMDGLEGGGALVPLVVAVVVTVCSVAASLAPALRATSVDPAATLTAE